MRSFFIAATYLVCLSAAVGCDDKPAPDATAPSATSTTKPTATASGPKAPTPKALDVGMLQKTLKCGKGAAGPCGVLEELKDCEKWSPVTQSGDGRWLGESFVVKKGSFIDELALMRSKRVALDQVGAGQLPVKIAVTDVPGDHKTNAGKAVRAYQRGDVPTKLNLAIDYIKQRQEWQGAFSVQAEDNQVYVASGGGVYICAHNKGQVLLLVKRSGDREHPADGVYARMYPVSW